MRNVMIDIETLGLVPGSVILSIAAVAFDQVNDDVIFDGSIDIGASVRAGLRIDEQTVDWHIKNKTAAIDQRANHFTNLAAALEEFFSEIEPSDILWANSPSFDIVLIEAAARKVGLDKWPWSYRNLRDLRTALSANPSFDKNSIKFVGQRHDPVDDCRHQIALLRASGFPM